MQPIRIQLSAAALLAALASAPAEISDARARDELAFARGLAAEWGFVELAQEVVADLEAAGVSKKVGEELGLVKCSIFFEGAKIDRNNRAALLQRAMEAYQDYIARYSFSELLPQAESELIGVASYYTRYLSTEFEDAVGEQAESLRERMQTVLDTAVEKTGELISGLRAIPPDDRSEAEKRQLFELLFDRGEMLLELAKTQEDGSFSFEASFNAFEDLVDEAGENSPWGLRAFIGIGDNQVAQGRFQDAGSFYEFVAEMAITRDQKAWEEAKEEMPRDELEKRFLFLQMATGGLVECYSMAGETAKATAWGLHFYNVWKREGLLLTQPIGHLSLLSVARTLVDAGGEIGGSTADGTAEWFATSEEAAAKHPAARDRRPAIDMALTMAQTVNKENRGNTLQLRAQRVISAIISRPGVQVDPETLFEAAQGQYFEKDYVAAIDGFKRVLSALQGQDAAKQQEMGPKTLWHIGRSFQSLDRNLEAAVTFREAVAPDSRWRGDPQYDGQNAEKYYETMRALRGNAGKDELIERWWRDAEDWAKDLTTTLGAEVNFRNAYDQYTAGDFAQAKATFQTVDPSAESYEKALVFIGVCEFKLGELEAAESAFDRYVNRFLKDPVNAVNDVRRRAKRSEAEATAWFYWGLVEYKQAEDGQGDWQEVLAKLADFHERFPDQTSFAPAALYRAMIAHTRLGDNKSARGVYEELLKVFGDSQWTGQASTDYYKILRDQHTAEQDPAKKRQLLVEMAEALQVLNSTSAKPSFNNMRSESRHWMDLGEWAKAETLLERIKAQFAATDAAEIDKFVRPDLGEALMRQYKVQEAADELAPLVEAKLADRKTARIYAKTLTGWLEHGDQDGQPVIKQVKGVGGAENFAKGAEILNQITEASEKWETDWYDLKAELFFAYHQWGALDGKKLEAARREINFLISSLGNPQFQNEKIEAPVRQEFLWLAQELK